MLLVAGLRAEWIRIVATGIDDPQVLPTLFAGAIGFVQGDSVRRPGLEMDFDLEGGVLR